MAHLETDLLIVGAGPFGLGMAAYCKHFDISHVVVGSPMSFWKSNMPKGMYLRSDVDWHLDPLEIHTIERFIETNNLSTDNLRPLSRDFYIQYVEWFREVKGIDVIETYVSTLDYHEHKEVPFYAQLTNGIEIRARRVLLAIGFKYFKNQLREYLEMVPQEQLFHTCDLVEFDGLKDKDCLLIGGRQSAFEWAALLKESGAGKVYLSYRHDTPHFTASDWTWIDPILDKFEEDSGWYQTLKDSEKETLNKKLWIEGRQKLEPWLFPRINQETVVLLPNTVVTNCLKQSNQKLRITLSNGDNFPVDRVILATGYKVDISKVPFLKNGNLLERIATINGAPELDKNLQTNIPGLYFTSMAATQDFGSFFAFTVSVKASARIVGSHLRNN